MTLLRYRLFQILVVLAFLLIAGRLFYLQVIQHGKYLSEAKRFQTKAKKHIARGEIVDRNGKVLAIDMHKYTLEFNPQDERRGKEVNKTELATKVAAILGVAPDAKFYQLFNRHNSQTISRGLAKDKADLIKKLNQSLPSQVLNLRRDLRRFYPQDFLASHLLGYVDVLGRARQGIEAKYEETLISNPYTRLSLSIDSRLQALTEKALDEHITKTGAERGTVIVMDTRNGQIMSWAIKPDFNPNEYYDFPLKDIKNWSSVDVYQAGSIFKIITVAGALESRTVDKDYTFLDEGFVKVDNWRISNHDYVPGKTAPAELNLQGLFERSSNPFTAHLALKMGAETLFNFIKLFGFGQKTGVELHAESAGILKDFKSWKNSDIAATSIGQGAIAVTPLQLLAAVNAIANNGVWIRPTILKSRKNSESSFRVVSAKTAKQVSKFLAGSVEHNVAERHSIAGSVNMRVAGKTGTAQKPKPGGGYYRHKTVASFIGFFPAENPRYIALVVIDDPKTDGGWGDTVAGPLFNKVANYCKNLYL